MGGTSGSSGRMTDALRVYALNLVLIPVNLVGVLSSLQQALAGTKAAFGRTPKLASRTRVAAVYLVAELGIRCQWLLRATSDVLEHRLLHGLLACVNIAFLAYGVGAFIGLSNCLADLAHGIRQSFLRAPLAPRGAGGLRSGLSLSPSVPEFLDGSDGGTA